MKKNDNHKNKELENDLKVPLFVALDVDSDKAAVELAQKLKSYVGGFKLGPRLTVRYGQDLIKEISKIAPVIVDNKYYDIPSTVEQSVQSTFEAGASFCTVHAVCGDDCLKRVADLEAELAKDRLFKVLAVTVLTSVQADDVRTLRNKVFSMARHAFEAGLSGLVSSAQETSKLRQHFPGSFLLTPGIRFMNERHGDQKRVMDPAGAIAHGASAIVVGRPVHKAPDPVKAAQSYYAAVMSERVQKEA